MGNSSSSMHVADSLVAVALHVLYSYRIAPDLCLMFDDEICYGMQDNTIHTSMYNKEHHFFHLRPLDRRIFYANFSLFFLFLVLISKHVVREITRGKHSSCRFILRSCQTLHNVRGWSYCAATSGKDLHFLTFSFCAKPVTQFASTQAVTL